MPPLLEQREEAEHAIELLGPAGLRPPCVAAHLEVLEDGHAREQTAALGHGGDPPPDDLARAPGVGRLGPDADRALAQPYHPEHRLHGVGLAGGVAAKRSDESALANLVAQVLSSRVLRGV